MNDRTRTFLDDLARAPLLARVGEPLPIGEDAILLGSWEEALNEERRAAASEARLEASAELTVFLHKNHMARYRGWNAITGELKPLVIGIVDPRCATVVEQHKLKTSPVDTVRWDCLAAAMGYEFADLKAPAFYDRLAKLYLAGRFPCGYVGTYPNGRLEVY